MNYIRQSLAPGLYLVGVPIGTARDITLRALDVLASADVLAAEDTRSLRKLMDIHGVPLEGRKIVALHEHSGSAVISRLSEAVTKGQSVAYASEAGMPLIADPGFELVRHMREQDLPVTSVPGPSAVPTALAISGLPTDAFHFTGFLPSSKSARRKALSQLGAVQATLVLFESPKRLAKCLADAAEMLGPQRAACICRELTKKFEESRRGSLGELAEYYSEHPARGEIVVLIARDTADAGGVSEIFVDEMLRKLMREVSLKDAASRVAQETGLKRRDVYQRALSLDKDEGTEDA